MNSPISLTRKSFLGLTAIALCVGLTTGTARADLVGTPILPGQTVATTANPAANLATETLLGTDLVNLSIGGVIHANLANAVYANSAGTLDFLFQFRNAADSVPVSSVTVNNYAGVITGVGYILSGLPAASPFIDPSSGTLPPLVAQRGPSGNDILFDGFTIPVDTTTNVFFVTTNARNFNDLGSALAAATTQSNGGTVFIQKFQPAAIPEPPVTVMMGLISLAGLGYRQYRKVRVQV